MKTKKELNYSITNWKKRNVVRKEALIPIEYYEKFEKELKKMGKSYNKWVKEKIEEII